MRTKLNKNLTNIRNFFNLIRTENPTKEEIYNFLLEMKTFVFSQYGLNENDYDITIQFVHPKVLDYDEASMCADEHNDKLFTISLNQRNLIGKYNLIEIRRNKENKKIEQDSTNLELQHQNRLKSILTLTQSYLHELGHVIQYIKTPNKMNQEDEIKDASYEALEQICFSLENSRKKRLIVKSLSKHINAMAYMSGAEKDANRKCHIYFANVLSILLSAEEDEEMIDFLLLLYLNTNKAKKHNYDIYRQYAKENREAISKLHDLELEKELDALSKKL